LDFISLTSKFSIDAVCSSNTNRNYFRHKSHKRFSAYICFSWSNVNGSFKFKIILARYLLCEWIHILYKYTHIQFKCTHLPILSRTVNIYICPFRGRVKMQIGVAANLCAAVYSSLLPFAWSAFSAVSLWLFDIVLQKFRCGSRRIFTHPPGLIESQSFGFSELTDSGWNTHIHLHIFTHWKNDFAEWLKINILLNTDLKITLLDHENNFVGNSKLIALK